MMISSSYGMRAIRNSKLSMVLAAECPAGKARLDSGSDRVENDAKHGEHQQSGEYDRYLESGLRVEHELADSLVCTDRLRNHGADESERDGDLERAEEIRQRARNADLAHDVELRGAERAQHV